MYQEHPEIASSIVGDLQFVDIFGKKRIPDFIHFLCEDSELGLKGEAVTHVNSDLYGNSWHPVLRGNGERLRIEGYDGLWCRYDSYLGKIFNFYEE